MVTLIADEAKRRHENGELLTFEVKLSCDAHGGFRSQKLTHWCLTFIRPMDRKYAANSPPAARQTTPCSI